MKPHIGKSKHHVRNSSDFASSLAYELLKTDEIKISFDVVSLFTSVPLPSWTESKYKFVNYRPNYMTWNLLKFNKLYFLWKTLQTSFWNSDAFSRFISGCKPSHGRRRKTRFGNLCRSSTFVEKIVYDTFVITKKSKLCEFFTHLNTIESSNQYTKEQKKEEYLPFLDLLDQTLIKSPLSVSSLSQANPFRQIPQL